MKILQPMIAGGLSLLLCASCVKTPRPPCFPPEEWEVLILNFPVPEHVPADPRVGKDILAAVAQLHFACGLTDGKFEHSNQTLQQVSAGTGYEKMVEDYTTVARLCHDVQLVQPQQSVPDGAVMSAKGKAPDDTPWLGMDIADLGWRAPNREIPIVTIMVHVAPGSWREMNGEEVVKLIEQNPDFCRSVDKFRNLEGWAYANIEPVLENAGFTEADAPGTWTWQTDGGTIKFELRDDKTMTCEFCPTTKEAAWSTGNYGRGVWRATDRRLLVEMLRTGHRDQSSTFNDHHQTLLDAPILRFTHEKLWVEATIESIGPSKTPLRVQQALDRVK